ncbi:UNVERIFIED_CONTAM: hypothetical protein K2H54_064080 [Gekko kuhli]
MEPGASEAAAAALGALAARAGGRERLVLVAERGAGEAPPRALLEGFARDLFAEPRPPDGAAAGVAEKGRRRARGGGRGWAWCPLAFVLLRGAASGGRAVRELVRDVRGQVAPWAALVAVLVVLRAGEEAELEAARLRVEALLRRACARRRRPALQQEALQAALYRPGSPHGAAPVRAAALRALRAALQLRADRIRFQERLLLTYG